MRGTKRWKKITFISLAVYAALFLALVAYVKINNYGINLTPSAAMGIWRLKAKDREYTTGKYILIEGAKLRENPQFNPYYARHASSGNMLKKILGVSGDRIARRDDCLEINGEKVSDGKFFEIDTEGNPLNGYDLPQILGAGEYWVHSRERGYDSRYFGPISEDAIKGVMEPIFVW